MALNASQTPILLIILIIISSIIGGLILVICATVICKYCYKIKMSKERTKSYDENISKSQSTITIYRNRKASRIDSVTATEVDEESITALVKKYKDTIDQDNCDINNSSSSLKDLFKVLTPTKDLSAVEIFIGKNNNKPPIKKSFMRDSSCQTFITLEDVIFTQRLTIGNEDIHCKRNNFDIEQHLIPKSNEMYHIVPPTDYRRNSQHLRPFDTHWGSNTLSRSFDQMPDKNLSNETRKTYSFDECEINPQPPTVVRTNSFDNRYIPKLNGRKSPVCKKEISVTSGQSSRTSSSISTMSINQNHHDSNAGTSKHKYTTVYARVRSCSRLGKDMSSVNSSFNSSSETNNCMIRSSYEINRPALQKNVSTPCRRKCNSERSPVRKVVVTRVTSKSLESRDNAWQPTEKVENSSNTKGRRSIVVDPNYTDRYIHKQNIECYPCIAKYPSSQYRQSKFSRHKSMDVTRNINDRSRSKTSSYCRINSDIDKNQLSLESEETLDRNAEPHLSKMGLVNISMDNSEHQFNNYQIIPDVVNSSIKDDKVHRTNRNQFQNLCRSNTSLERSNNLATSASIRRRQFSQERRKVEPNRKDSKGSISKSVYDDYSSFMLDNLDDKKGKSMIFDRFFSSQMISYENNPEIKIKPLPAKQSYNTNNTNNNNSNYNESIEIKDVKTEETRINDEFMRNQQRMSSKYLRSKSQNQDQSDKWNNQPLYNDPRSNLHMNNCKNPNINRRQLSEKEGISNSIDRTIPKIIFSDNE